MVDLRTINRIQPSASRFAASLSTNTPLRQEDKPSSPLITLLQSLHPRERAQISAVRVCRSVGYQGGRLFFNAQQALN